MEIAPVPHRASTRGERRWLLLALLVVTPAVLLVLVPAVLGLQRYVVTDSAMTGAVGRGAVVLARPVPVTDLARGDVISFAAPSGPDRGDRVTREVVTAHGDLVTTRSDTAGADRWRLDAGSYEQVWVSVPWLGLPFVVGGGWLLLSALAAVALAIAVLAGRSHHAESLRRAAATRPTRPSGPTRPRLPVA